MTTITLSERIEMLKIAHSKRKASKLAMADLAEDVEIEDSLGVGDSEDE